MSPPPLKLNLGVLLNEGFHKKVSKKKGSVGCQRLKNTDLKRQMENNHSGKYIFPRLDILKHDISSHFRFLTT